MDRPNYAGPAVLVSLSIYVLNIPFIDINKHTGEMSLEMFWRHHWTDQRLKFDKASFLGGTFQHCIVLVKGAVEKIIGGEEIVERIWVPDTYVYNEHSSEYKETFISISSEGEVNWSRRVQLVVTEVWRNS